MSNAQIGMIGLGVMGANLARNLESHGLKVAVYNRTSDATEKFMKDFGDKNFVASESLVDFVKSLAKPRKIILMVKAGKPVDYVLDDLLPLVESGDLIIDAGNTYFKETVSRTERCLKSNVHFLGVGVSGGEYGALTGPSIMPGGDPSAYALVKPMFEQIAAQVDGPCVTYIGADGAGHYVKMVHNGIEYADMQIIAESYQLLSDLGGKTPADLNQIFTDWNNGVLSSYLIEITSKIFQKKDANGDGYLVDKILDQAGQKGTGKWTVIEALELGVAIPAIAAAVDARVLSSLKPERVNAAKVFSKPELKKHNSQSYVQQVHDALYCSKIMAYAQGMALLAAAGKEYKWDLKLGEISAIWRGGCIIRANFLEHIREAYARDPKLANLILDEYFKKEVARTISALRLTVAQAAEAGIPVPAFSASLAYFDSYSSKDLPQNLTQAQRDFFGAHTYERKDQTGSFHTEWE